MVYQCSSSSGSANAAELGNHILHPTQIFVPHLTRILRYRHRHPLLGTPLTCTGEFPPSR